MIKCPYRKQCLRHLREICEGNLPTNNPTFKCQSKIEWVITPVKTFGRNVTSHIQAKQKRLSKPKKKKSTSKNRTTKKDIRRYNKYKKEMEGK